MNTHFTLNNRWWRTPWNGLCLRAYSAHRYLARHL